MRSASFSIALFISSNAIIRITKEDKHKKDVGGILSKKHIKHVMIKRITSRRKDFSALKH
jgi:hypothetical protein